MENWKNKIIAITFVFILSIITGCGISITRNQYYGYPDPKAKITKKDVASKQIVDTLLKINNGQN